ncbi:MAG: hypothetical protein ACLUI3_07210 [Christensenellales bacterium]
MGRRTRGADAGAGRRGGGACGHLVFPWSYAVALTGGLVNYIQFRGGCLR